MRPHYSQSSCENATPSSGTSLLASHKGVWRLYNERIYPGSKFPTGGVLVLSCKQSFEQGYSNREFILFNVHMRGMRPLEDV